jgi:hypothetical protein
MCERSHDLYGTLDLHYAPTILTSLSTHRMRVHR